MTAKEFKEVFAIAQEHNYDSDPLAVWKNEGLKALEGIALDKTRRIATKQQCAFVLNWQALYFNGEYDMEELARTKEYFKRVDLLD